MFHKKVQQLLCSLIYSYYDKESEQIFKMVNLTEHEKLVLDNTKYDVVLANIDYNSIIKYNLTRCPYIGKLHWLSYESNNIYKSYTIYFQRGRLPITCATLTCKRHHIPYSCYCQNCNLQTCPAITWIIEEYNEIQLNNETILNMLINDINFLQILQHIWNGSKNVIDRLVEYGEEMGMKFFNPLNLLNTNRYSKLNVCIVCHTYSDNIYCDNQFCVQTVNEYCNNLITTIMNYSVNIPTDCIKIILKYSTHFYNIRYYDDLEDVSNEFLLMGKFIME
jgi:hypothetical protein